jgi:Ca2+-binding RTX toxin-like protein
MDDFDTVLLQGLGGNDTITILDPITAGSLTRKCNARRRRAATTRSPATAATTSSAAATGWTRSSAWRSRRALRQAGNDQLFGGVGLDFLDGGDNDDFIDSSDSAGGDTVLGGNGAADSARVDAGDETSGVESFV